MGAVPALRRVSKKKTTVADLVLSIASPAPQREEIMRVSKGDDDGEEEAYIIEVVSGGSHCQDGTVQHRILWEGFPAETDSWTTLGEDYVWDVTPHFQPRALVSLMPPGSAYAKSKATKRTAKDPFYDIYSVVHREGTMLHLLRQAGHTLKLDLLHCRAQDREVDWVLHVGAPPLFTDAIIDWDASDEIRRIHEDYREGTDFPATMEARILCRLLPGAFEAVSEDPGLRQATIDLDLWMRRPNLDPSHVTLAKQNAATLRSTLLPYRVLHNALGTVVGLDQGQVKQFVADTAAHERANPGERLWTEAGL